jgi:hypothetical protein
MDRAELARILIEAEPLEHFPTKINESPAFAGQYPFGFAPIGKVAAGDFLEFSPSGVAYAGRDFADAQFRAFCLAIRLWQQTTITNFGMQLPPDLIVQAFATDQPDAAAVLAAAALHHRCPLVRFVGADRGTGVHS